MWTIRKAKRSDGTTPQREVQKPPSDAVPRFAARQSLMLLRMTVFAFDHMERVFRALPPDQQPLYEHLAHIEVRPAFIDVMKLIDLSEERGLFTFDEASSIRAGRVGGIDNPIPDYERNGDDVRA
ncbi:MAG: hypothetical protein A4E19_05940 [Nitrospira sp. SG-bin1]|nr:MAG: hypothetical protein A4E19_05940 [Nitrospira sp. SG-bin1]